MGAHDLPKEVPDVFKILRPWVHKGWEMVVIAAELVRPESSLLSQGPATFAENYSFHCQEALHAWGWHRTFVQKALENARREALMIDRYSWLAMHQPFPEVLQLIKKLKDEGIDVAVLTTKSAEFTIELLNFLQIQPNQVFGHESGSKAKVLLDLIKTRSVLGFIEDRRRTLEEILALQELSAIPCYLASWGYLKSEDKDNLPSGIYLLKPEELASPLASWN